MNRSEALTLVGVLEAAFPAGGHGDETTQLYASQFERYPFNAGNQAVRRLIDERQSSFLPSWAEVRDAIVHYMPPSPRELEPPVSGPTAEFLEAKRKLQQALNEKGETEFDKLRAAVRMRYVLDKQAGKLAESTGAPEEAS